jgi:hypothetical protein
MGCDLKQQPSGCCCAVAGCDVVVARPCLVESTGEAPYGMVLLCMLMLFWLLCCCCLHLAYWWCPHTQKKNLGVAFCTLESGLDRGFVAAGTVSKSVSLLCVCCLVWCC